MTHEWRIVGEVMQCLRCGLAIINRSELSDSEFMAALEPCEPMQVQWLGLFPGGDNQEQLSGLSPLSGHSNAIHSEHALYVDRGVPCRTEEQALATLNFCQSGKCDKYDPTRGTCTAFGSPCQQYGLWITKLVTRGCERAGDPPPSISAGDVPTD